MCSSSRIFFFFFFNDTATTEIYTFPYTTLFRSEIERVRQLFAAAPPDQARVLVVHHNVLRGDISRRMGLARWRQAQRRIAASGAELVLCEIGRASCRERV